MANTVYPAYRNALLGGLSLDLSAVDVKLVLVDLADYTYNAAHDFLDDVPAGARVAESPALASKTLGTVGPGVFDCADPTITGVTGDQLEAVIVFVDTGSDATSRLLAFIDTEPDSDPISFLPNGSDVLVTIPASGLFTI
jgi:hypothetical protein